MAIEFENHPLLGLQLTPTSKDILREIRQATELYYFLKHANLPEPEVSINNIGTAQLSNGSLVGYTPDPEGPYPPYPWPWPFPWWHRNHLDQLINIADGGLHDLGATLADPVQSISVGEQIKSTAFHLKAAESALATMDKARDELKRNIAQLQKMK